MKIGKSYIFNRIFNFLYRKYIFTNNTFMQTVVIVCLLYTVMVFPLYYSINGIYDSNVNKTYYAISIFNIDLIVGYLKITKVNLIIYINKKKKIIDLIKYFADKKNRIKINVKPFKINNCLICGVSNDFYIPLVCASQAVSNTILPVLKYKYPHIKIKNDIAFVNNNRIREVVFVSGYINVLDIINELINKIKG